jgi:hypothetical protein
MAICHNDLLEGENMSGGDASGRRVKHDPFVTGSKSNAESVCAVSLSVRLHAN